MWTGYDLRMIGELIENEDEQALARSLIGRTITRVLWFDMSPGEDWTHHETAWLFLDDGRVIEFGSWGHDADGATMDAIEVINVASCLHCGKPHGDLQVYRKESTGARYAFCEDRNHKAWLEVTPTVP